MLYCIAWISTYMHTAVRLLHHHQLLVILLFVDCLPHGSSDLMLETHESMPVQYIRGVVRWLHAQLSACAHRILIVTQYRKNNRRPGSDILVSIVVWTKILHWVDIITMCTNSNPLWNVVNVDAVDLIYSGRSIIYTVCRWKYYCDIIRIPVFVQSALPT